MCIGLRFGLGQIKAATAAIVREFKITLSANHKPFELDPEAMMWQAKDGLLVNFERRQLD